jgi:hypothetical protein
LVVPVPTALLIDNSVPDPIPVITEPPVIPIGVPLTGIPTAKPDVLFAPNVKRKLDPVVDESMVTIGNTPKFN